MTAHHFETLDLFAAPLHGLGLIEASAGTGKTWTITGLYVRLIVEEGYSAEQILVVTYTKAATAELRERIRRRLGEALTSMAKGHAPDDFCQRLVERAVDRGQRGLAMRRLQTAIRNFDEAAIFTIHGFCQRVLTENAFESGVAFETELAPDESAIVQEIVDDFWRRETANASAPWSRFLADKGQTPDAWRDAARPYLDKPYLEIAPVPAPNDDHAMEKALSDAFAAARSLWQAEREAIAKTLIVAAESKRLKNTSYRPDALPLWFEDFDEYFATEEAGTNPPDKLKKLTPDELAKGASKNQTPPAHAFFDASSGLIVAAEALAEHFHLKLIGLHIRLIGECNDELPRRKSRLGLMSYNDLLNRLAEALQAQEGRHLADTLRERYRAALIDEFQDTDPVQYRIFQAIYGEAEQPVFLVGDPKQAIYGFRGADVFSYLQARRQTSAHYTLAVNQRSEPKLIEAVNALFRRSSNPFLLSDIHFPEVQAADKARPKLLVEGDGDEPFRFALAETSGKALSKETANTLAAQATATEIVRLLNLAAEGRARLETSSSGPAGNVVESSPMPSPPTGFAPLASLSPQAGEGNKSPSLPGGEGMLFRPINGGDIAVLVPTHRQGELIQEALSARGAPSVRQGQDNVFLSTEAMEFERVLLAIAEPRRENRIKSALATEIAGFDAAALFALQNDENAWEKVLFDFARYRELWLGRGFMPMFRLWLEESGAIERLLRCRDGERRLTNLLHLAELLQVKSAEKPAMDGLLGWFSRAVRDPEGDEEALLRLESDAERIKIVTIHASKGLEYPIVFCPFLWDGNLWKKGENAALFHDPAHGFRPMLNLGGAEYDAHHRLASREKLAEKLRLLYVALTRAKHRCHVVWGAVSGMEASALAWLLHGPNEATEDPLGVMAAIFEGLDHAAIKKTLDDFATSACGAVAVHDLIINKTRYSPSAVTAPALRARMFTRTYLRPDWRMTSFSALARGRHSESPDYDPTEPSSKDQPFEASLFAFPRGAGAGRCLHAILEEWDFSSRDSDALERLVRRKLKAHAIDEAWTNVVASAMEATLAADLDGEGLKLMNIDARNRLAELEFTYPLHNLEVDGIKKQLANRRLGLPEAFALAAESLDFETVRGYMKGFIDLVFEANGRFFLLDYKSNWLGPTPQDYAPPRLLQAMAREHYYLQYLIYSLGLHRYLKLRLADYAYERHFGGVFYLFLRGVGHPGAPRCGIFQDRPSRNLIESLDERLS